MKARDFARALAGYEDALRIDPSAPFAAPARARSSDLRAHSEGGFEPLRRVEEVRRDPEASQVAVEALAHDLASFPDGRVRSEARIVAAEALWHRFGAPERAIELLSATIDDASADKTTRALSLSELVAIRRERGEIAQALAASDRAPDLLPGLREELVHLVRRGRLSRAFTLLLMALATLGLASIVRLGVKIDDLRDLPSVVVRPAMVAASLFLGGGAAILARLHGGGDPRPFVWLGLGVLGLSIIARSFRLAWGLGPPVARLAWAVGCVAGVAAVAFVAMERTEVSYLESFGL